MIDLLSFVFNLLLIGLLIPAIMFAVKLSRQINSLRATRLEMEKIIATFNATVLRCETGIRELKLTARTSGDDLEKLIERGQILRDELVFISESADQIATRLADTAAQATRQSAETAAPSASGTGASGAASANAASVPSPDAVARVREVLALAEGGLKKILKEELKDAKELRPSSSGKDSAKETVAIKKTALGSGSSGASAALATQAPSAAERELLRALEQFR